jgi:hypothetical protein
MHTKAVEEHGMCLVRCGPDDGSKESEASLGRFSDLGEEEGQRWMRLRKENRKRGGVWKTVPFLTQVPSNLLL